MSTDWDKFEIWDEKEQAKFLLRVAVSVLPALKDFSNIHDKVGSYLILAAELIEGTSDNLEGLMIFLDDPDLDNSFVNFYETTGYTGDAAACLDIATYASAFVCRVVAGRLGLSILPDPVIEALPDIYEYYYEKAKSLGV